MGPGYYSWISETTKYMIHCNRCIIESVDSISRDELDAPLMQNAGITRARYTIMHFKQHNRVLWLISNQMSV